MALVQERNLIAVEEAEAEKPAVAESAARLPRLAGLVSLALLSCPSPPTHRHTHTHTYSLLLVLLLLLLLLVLRDSLRVWVCLSRISPSYPSPLSVDLVLR
jgi:hypothetical protein